MGRVCFWEEGGENGYILCEQPALSTVSKSSIPVLLLCYSPDFKKSSLWTVSTFLSIKY